MWPRPRTLTLLLCLYLPHRELMGSIQGCGGTPKGSINMEERLQVLRFPGHSVVLILDCACAKVTRSLDPSFKTSMLQDVEVISPLHI